MLRLLAIAVSCLFGLAHADDKPSVLFTDEPEVISKGHEFAEGMAFDAKGNFYFTDVPAGKLFKIDAVTGEKSLFDGDTGRTNGIAVGSDGMLYGCSGGARVIHQWDRPSSQGGFAHDCGVLL